MTRPSAEEVKEAVERFGVKTAADFASLLPAVAVPAIGTYLGRRYGGDVGQLVGAIGGGVAGKVLSDQIRDRRQPQGSPYALDPTDVDIPPWALQGAQFFGPAAKQASGTADVLMGDNLGQLWPVVEGLHKHETAGQIGKKVLGGGLGTIGGGLLGHGAGALLNRAAGHEVTIPGLNIPVSTILSGLGATMGNVKGLEYARGQ